MSDVAYSEKHAILQSLALYDAEDAAPPQSRFMQFRESFKRAVPTKDNKIGYAKCITKRHLRMTALSTGLGTGLLVASGQKLRAAGPGGVLVAYAMTGYLMVVPTINSASELSIAYPGLAGGFQSFYAKFIDESYGFALGWNYATNSICVVALELVVAAMTVKFWTTAVNPDVFVAIVFAIVVCINFCGALAFAECEFAMNAFKVMLLTGFIVFGLCVDLGASLTGFIGGQYWRDPGAFTSFKGLATVFVASAFSLGGSEFISLQAAEVGGNVRQAIRAASKLIFFKITVLFVGSLIFVGLLVPHTSELLLSANGEGKNASPYVIAAQMHGIRTLPHIINAIILVSVTSVASAAFYCTPRLIQSLAQQGLGWKWLSYVDRAGRPLRAMLVTTVFGFVAFIATYKKQGEVFNWLLSISALSFVMVWLSISISHLRFRAALKYNNIPLLSLGYLSPTGVIGSYMSICINVLILVVQFWTSLFPMGAKKASIDFLQGYLGCVILLVLYVGHKFYCKEWRLFKPVSEIDIDKDRYIYDRDVLELERMEEMERYQSAPLWKKALICIFE